MARKPRPGAPYPGADQSSTLAQACLDMRTRGLMPSQIAATLCVPQDVVLRYLDETLAKVAHEYPKLALQVFALYHCRMEALLSTVWPLAMSGDLDAIAEARAILAQQAKDTDMGAATRRALDAGQSSSKVPAIYFVPAIKPPILPEPTRDDVVPPGDES